MASRRFKIGGYRWILDWYPSADEPNSDGNMSFYLFLDQGNVVDPMMVQYEFSFVTDRVQTNNQSLLGRVKGNHKFCSNNDYKLICIKKRAIFEKSNYLKNDSFTVRCDIIIYKDVNINEAIGGAIPVSDVLPSPPIIPQDLSGLLQSDTGADVTFQVRGRMFRAHRCVLAAQSAVFKAQLFGPMKEGTSTSIIHVRDMEEQVFKLLLGFIYSDSVPECDDIEEDKIMWQHFLEAADRYDLPRLTLVCKQELCAYINTNTVATFLALAEQHHCGVLKEACLDFLNSPSNLQEVIGLDGLDHLISRCPSILKDVIMKLNTGCSSVFALPPFVMPKSEIHLELLSLFESKERTDVTFQVTREAMCAHWCLLASRSAVFKVEFFGPMKDTASDIIHIDDIEAGVFKLLLTFIYTDTVPMMKKRKQGERNDGDANVMWQQLLVAADRYGVQGLRQMCERRLGSYINTDTVATIVALAEQHHCRKLKEECLDFLDFPAHLKQVMAVGGLDHLRRSCSSVLVDLVARLAAV